MQQTIPIYSLFGPWLLYNWSIIMDWLMVIMIWFITNYLQKYAPHATVTQVTC